MAANFKKRALAEYASTSAVKEEPAMAAGDNNDGERGHPVTPGVVFTGKDRAKRLKKALAAVRGAAGNRGAGGGQQASSLGELDEALGDSRRTAAILSRFQSNLPEMDDEEAAQAAEKLGALVQRDGLGEDSRRQVVLAAKAALEAKTAAAAPSVRESIQGWLGQLPAAAASGDKTTSVLLGLLCSVYRCGDDDLLSPKTHKSVHSAALERISWLDTSVAVNALTLAGLCATKLADKSEADKTMALVGSYSQSSEPRVRHAALSSLQSSWERGHQLEISLYGKLSRFLDDDFEGVRSVALQLLFAMAADYPEEQVQPSGRKSDREGIVETIRLVDDAFGQICKAINDLSVKVMDHLLTVLCIVCENI